MYYARARIYTGKYGKVLIYLNIIRILSYQILSDLNIIYFTCILKKMARQPSNFYDGISIGLVVSKCKCGSFSVFANLVKRFVFVSLS